MIISHIIIIIIIIIIIDSIVREIGKKKMYWTASYICAAASVTLGLVMGNTDGLFKRFVGSSCGCLAEVYGSLRAATCLNSESCYTV